MTDEVIRHNDASLSVALPGPLKRWARVAAAQRDQTMSEFIRYLLEMERERQRARVG
jgi:hypothetical protein